MELKDIKELMKILKKEDMAEMKVRYGKIKLTLVNSEEDKTPVKIEKIEQAKTEKKEIEVEKTKVEEIIKSKNIGEIRLLRIDEGMEVTEGMVLAKINTIGIETDVISPVNGILKQILVLDQSMVDYGKKLFVVEEI